MDTATLTPETAALMATAPTAPTATAPTAPTATAPAALLMGKAFKPGEGHRDVSALRKAHKAEMHAVASERAAALHRATRSQALIDRSERQEAGVYGGREGYTAWTVEQREAIRDALDGAEVSLTLGKLHGTKRGQRVTLTGVCMASGHAVAIRAEVSVMDTTAPDLTGLSIPCKLEARRDFRRDGSPFTNFRVASVGLASNGLRIGVQGQATVSRHVRVSVASLALGSL